MITVNNLQDAQFFIVLLNMSDNQEESNCDSFSLFLDQFISVVDKFLFRSFNVKMLCKFLYRYKIFAQTEDCARALKKLEQINVEQYNEKNFIITYVCEALKKQEDQPKVIKLTKKPKDKEDIQGYYSNFFQPEKGSPDTATDQECEAYLTSLSTSKISIHTCFGCLKRTYHNLQYPSQACQTYLTINPESPTFNEGIMQTFCSILNSGGGYIIVLAQKKNMNELEQISERIWQQIKKNKSWQNQIQFKKEYMETIVSSNLSMQQNNEAYYDIKIEVRPGDPRKLYFIDRETLKSRIEEIFLNKYHLGMPIRMQMLDNLDIYTTSSKFYQSGQGYPVCSKAQCIPLYPERRKIINSMALEEVNLSDKPGFLYKNSYIMLFPRGKAVQMANKIRAIFEEYRFTPYFIRRPFNIYNKKSHSAIYFYSTDKSYDDLLKAFKEQQQKNQLENKYVLISVTRLIQLPIADKGEKKAKEQKQLKELAQQLDKNGLKNQIYISQPKMAKYPYSAPDSPNCLNIFYRCKNMEAAIFSFVIMYSVGLKAFLVKENKYN